MPDFSQVLINIAQSVPGFLMAIVFHEAAHAFVANRFGDPTAKMAGRLTLNPAAHYDMWGTILFPLISAISGFAVIGWAKPVPVDTRNFKEMRKATFWVSFAGPLSNIILGLISAFLCALWALKVSPEFGYYAIVINMLKYSVLINMILAFFNLIPLPPLDGSRMVASMLKGKTLYQYESLARYTPMIFIGAIVLSFMGFSTFGRILMPAQILGQKMLMFFFSFLGGL